MKLQILKDEDKIEGFTQVYVRDYSLDLSNISNNECELILANNALDYVSLSESEQMIKALVSKLRIGGQLVIGGTDVKAFCKNVANDSINLETSGRILQSVRSMTSSSVIKELIQSLGLKIQTSQLSGIHYEFVTSRS